MADDSAQEKTEQPTQRRRRRAREKGQVAQSTEVDNAAVLLAGLCALMLFGGGTFKCMIDQVSGYLGNLCGPEVTLDGVVPILRNAAKTVVVTAMPIAISVCAFSLLCSLAQTKGFVFAPSKIKLDLNVMNPVRGLKSLASWTAVGKLLAACVKITIIVLIVYFFVRARIGWLIALAGKDLWYFLNTSQKFCMTLVFQVALAMILVAVADYAFQKWRYEKKLKMSKQELKEEMKQEEGHPGVRGRQGQLRRQIARARMLDAVPDANVVVVNPVEIAVALKWDEAKMGAPQVVAKGRHLLAQRIKEIAVEHGVPIVERKPLAQALYAAVEVGMEIPSALYYAVAEVLAFVMGGKKAGRARKASSSGEA